MQFEVHDTIYEWRDLFEHYDEELLSLFYNTVMKKYFPIEDELDPLEAWIDLVSPTRREEINDPFLPDMHVCVIMQQNSIAAGCVYEYYKMSNCVLLSYIVVVEEFQAKGLGKVMIQHSFKECEKIYSQQWKPMAYPLKQFQSIISKSGKSSNHATFLLQFLQYSWSQQVNNRFFAYFAETNAAGVSDGVMESEHRHIILNKMGFEMLDFEYIQPPLSEEQEPCYDLLLLALKNSSLPIDEETGKPFIPTLNMLLFMMEFCYSVYDDENRLAFLEAPYYQQMVQDLMQNRGTKLFLHALPWTRRTIKPEGQEVEQ